MGLDIETAIAHTHHIARAVVGEMLFSRTFCRMVADESVFFVMMTEEREKETRRAKHVTSRLSNNSFGFSLKLHLRKYNHRRAAEGPEEAGPSGANGGTPSSPPTPMSMASSMDASSALQRLSDSFTPMDISSPQPPATLAQTLGLAPMVNQPPLNYASQMIMRQQQVCFLRF